MQLFLAPRPSRCHMLPMPDRNVRDPSPEEFSLDNEGLRVTHGPTGATFSTYRYEDPEKTASIVTRNWGRAGEALDDGSEYERQPLQVMAVALLRKAAGASPLPK